MVDSSFSQEIPYFCNEANNHEKKWQKKKKKGEKQTTFFQERNNLEQNIVICATGL